MLPVIVLALVLALVAPAQADVGDVPAGRTIVAIGQSGIGRVDDFAAATGTRPAAGMWYLGLYDDAEVARVGEELRAAVASHPGLVVNLGVSFGSLSTPRPPSTAAIAAGAHDATIRRLAGILRALPTVAYLRLGYEFDLLGGQYGPPAAYKAAYRHVVDVLRAEGVRNAAYVWHSAGAFWRATDRSVFATGSGTVATAAPAVDPQPIAAFYPGRGYVDAFAISYWQDSCCLGRSSPQARAAYEARTRELLAQARGMGLPLQIGESTPAYVGANSGAESVAWLDATFDLVEDFDIEMLSLISIDWREGGFFAAPFWNGYWPDARIHHYADTRARYLERTASRRYLARSRSLPRRLGYRAAR